MKKALFLLSFAAAIPLACSTSGGGAPATRSAPAPTPTPGPVSRLNPNVIEETPTYFIERFPKKDYIRVDDRHIRSPIIPLPVEFFREDEQYYYVYTPKVLPEEEAAKEAVARKALPPPPGVTPSAEPAAPANDYGMPPADFEDLTPARVSGRLRLEEVKPSGLPEEGMWRHSFAIADMNGDGIPDIVAPPSRLGADPTLHIWLGDGHGRFTRWKLTYLENGKVSPNFSLDYGGVAVGDIDGDGKPDVVAASHTAGLSALFGDGTGRFEVVRKGLPRRGFSTQAVALADVNGDGKLDIIASSDTYDYQGAGWDPHQLRVYLYDGARGWKYEEGALTDGAYSNSVTAWDYNGDGRLDILTGSQAYGAVQLLWKNEGNGKFTTGYFPQIEIHGYHFSMAPGTFGRERLPAFADAFVRATNVPAPLQAQGITVYSYKDGAWTRHRVWRKKEGRGYLYALAMGDIDGDGLDDIVFPDSFEYRLRVFFQQPDGAFLEAAEKEEPRLDSPGQCVRLADLDGDGRLDIVVSKTYVSGSADRGGWSVYLNRSGRK